MAVIKAIKPKSVRIKNIRDNETPWCTKYPRAAPLQSNQKLATPKNTPKKPDAIEV